MALRTNTYTRTIMNTYTNIVAPGAHDVIGAANVNSTVTVNGQSTYRRGEYFHAVVTTNNASSAHWQPVDVAISGGASVSGNLYTSKQANLKRTINEMLGEFQRSMKEDPPILVMPACIRLPIFMPAPTPVRITS